MSSDGAAADTSEIEGARGLVPKLRFPKFRDSGTWRERALANVADMRAGKFVSAAEISSNDDKGLFPCFGGNGLRGYTATYTHTGKYPLIGRQGALCGNVNLATESFYATEHAVVANARNGISVEWLYHLLVRYDLNRLKTGQAQPGLSVDVLGRLPCAVPNTLEEQHKIADCLSSLDAVIAAEEKRLALLRTQKRGLMQALFPAPGRTAPRLRFPEFESAGEWVWTDIASVATVQSGSTPSRENDAFWQGSIPWVTAKDMKHFILEDTEDRITSAAVENGTRLVPAGTLLILTRGMTLLKDIPICILRREMSLNQDVKALQPRGNTYIPFIALALLAAKKRILNLVDIAGHGTGKLDTAKLEAFEFAIPEGSEQRRISDCLFSLDEVIAASASRLRTFKLHKSGLMQQLFPSPAATTA